MQFNWKSDVVFLLILLFITGLAFYFHPLTGLVSLVSSIGWMIK